MCCCDQETEPKANSSLKCHKITYKLLQPAKSKLRPNSTNRSPNNDVTKLSALTLMTNKSTISVNINKFWVSIFKSSSHIHQISFQKPMREQHVAILLCWVIVNLIIIVTTIIIIITGPKPPYGRQGLAGSWGKDAVWRVKFSFRRSARIGYCWSNVDTV